ncbi:MAG: DUF1795 domain-containing protein [Planctomycetes bacterium]|nr:DUF1795 domain-containing protein [Planctomycetota bacterium]
MPLGRLTIFMLAGAALMLLSGCGGRAGEHEYTAGFSIVLPEGWERRENYRDMALVAVAPVDERRSDEFPVNLNVRIVGNPDALSLEEFYDEHFQTDVAKRSHVDFKLVEATVGKLGDLTAKRIVYSHTIGSGRLKSLAYAVLDAGTGYIITCNAPVDAFGRHLPVFERICASFEPRS